MKYQIGDKVLVLHSDEEGVIVDFINKQMAMVEVRGVKFPVYLDQIDFPYYKQFTKKKKVAAPPPKQYVDDLKKERPSKEERVEDGVWLNFLPVMDMDEFGDDYVEKLKIYLVNNTKRVYRFDYNLTFFGTSDFDLKGTLHPFKNFYVHDVEFGDMSDSPAFEFDFSLAETEKGKADHFEKIIKLKPKQLFGRIEELKQKNEASFSYLLFERYPDKAPEEVVLPLDKLAHKGYKIYNAKEARKHLEPARSVVDLHIEKLTDNHSGMSNFEILALQLQTFEKFYELAVGHMQPTLIIIHGVGTGRLRDEIHDALKLKDEVNYFINQYDPRYGYGATEIFLKY
ncbi:Smr/MutS family protein [Niabella insulamsoli]|uniref:Smr/MutS family protein n=1 Tax=Niabella insulamsoli TaxID=3144874 RepID=UPI0031FD4034